MRATFELATLYKTSAPSASQQARDHGSQLQGNKGTLQLTRNRGAQRQVSFQQSHTTHAEEAPLLAQMCGGTAPFFCWLACQLILVSWLIGLLACWLTTAWLAHCQIDAWMHMDAYGEHHCPSSSSSAARVRSATVASSARVSVDAPCSSPCGVPWKMP